jgi:hypothetical protein
VGLEKDKVRLGGTMILYNNMLQSLFSSQIKTLGFRGPGPDDHVPGSVPLA